MGAGLRVGEGDERGREGERWGKKELGWSDGGEEGGTRSSRLIATCVSGRRRSSLWLPSLLISPASFTHTIYSLTSFFFNASERNTFPPPRLRNLSQLPQLLTERLISNANFSSRTGTSNLIPFPPAYRHEKARSGKQEYRGWEWRK